jgi:hypothetical protein
MPALTFVDVVDELRAEQLVGELDRLSGAFLVSDGLHPGAIAPREGTEPPDVLAMQPAAVRDGVRASRAEGAKARARRATAATTARRTARTAFDRCDA